MFRRRRRVRRGGGAEGRGGGDLGVGEVVDDGRLAAGMVEVEDVDGAGDVCRGG